MKRRLLATFLSLCLLVGLLPTVALATDEEPGAEPAPVCTRESLCTEGAADKTCPVCAADYTVGSYTAPAEPVEEPTEEPTVELEDAVRARGPPRRSTTIFWRGITACTRKPGNRRYEACPVNAPCPTVPDRRIRPWMVTFNIYIA